MAARDSLDEEDLRAAFLIHAFDPWGAPQMPALAGSRTLLFGQPHAVRVLLQCPLKPCNPSIELISRMLRAL